ncbi:MAG: bacteriohemerythrin [Chromatiales bacterium]|nr:bacteriohemerythrin [Chromatiales bacterium]
MAQIEWQSGYDTGIEAIDSQHREIVTLINRLEVATHGSDHAEVTEILRRIQDYVTNHFSYEESLLEQAGFKFAESHVRTHHRFTQRLDSLQQRFDAGGYVTKELLNFLQRWLISHIAHEDQMYVSVVKKTLNEV